MPLRNGNLTDRYEQQLVLLRAAAEKGFAEIDQGRGIELASSDELATFIAKVGERARVKAKVCAFIATRQEGRLRMTQE